ncbi:ABC transporter permease subunit [Thermococcus sp.]
MNIQQAAANNTLNTMTYLKYYLPPAFTLFLAMVWEYAFTISTFIQEEKEEYHVVADKAKGLPDGRIKKKLLRVALPSFLTYTTYNFIDMLMNLLVVELVFSVPGLGYLLVASFKVIHKGPDGIYLLYRPQLIFFVSFVILFLYTINSILMEGLYIYWIQGPRGGSDMGKKLIAGGIIIAAYLIFALISPLLVNENAIKNWNSRMYWADYSSLAPPEWINLFGENLPTTENLSSVKIGPDTYRMEYNFKYSQFPLNLKIKFISQPEGNIIVNMTTPDGRTYTLYNGPAKELDFGGDAT